MLLLTCTVIHGFAHLQKFIGIHIGFKQDVRCILYIVSIGLTHMVANANAAELVPLMYANGCLPFAFSTLLTLLHNFVR